MTFKASPLFLFCLAFPPALQAVPVLTSAGANTWLNAVSADGSTACGAMGDLNNYSAIRWRPATGPVVLAGWSTQAEAHGLSGNGSIVVGESNSGGGLIAAKWDATGIKFEIPQAADAGSLKVATAFGISEDGSLAVGRYYSSGGGRSFKWTVGSGLPTNLADTSNYSEARAISGDGATIVGYRVGAATDIQATYKKGTNATVDLGDFPGGSISSFAFACSADGSVIVGEGTVAGEKKRGFRWTPVTQMTLLNAIPPSIPNATVESSALGVSGNGEITVGVSFVNQPGTDGTTPGGGGPTGPISTETAVVWLNNSGEPRSLQSLLTAKSVDTTGWTFQKITGISRSGNVIVGHGTKNGVKQGFVITNALEIFADTVLPIPQITISRTAENHPTIQLTTQPGFNYQIERSADLTSGSWIGYETISSVGNTGPVIRNITDFSVDLTEADPPKFFYRIRIKTP